SEGGTGAITAAAARTNLGATSIGNALFTAASTAVARSALGISSIGDSLFAAASAALARSAIGLGNVDNTSDADKPVSTAAAEALSTGLALKFAKAHLPAGTKMLFAQTAAPTGWVKDTDHNNKALRVVSGTAGSGGALAFTSAFASRSISGSV